MRRTGLVLAAALLALATPAAAQIEVDPVFPAMSRVDDLAPTASPFTADRANGGLYEAALTALFREALSGVHVVVQAQYAPEYALAIVHQGGAASILYLRASKRIADDDPKTLLDDSARWRDNNAATLSDADRAAHLARVAAALDRFQRDHAGLRPARCEAPLDPALAGRIEAVWLGLLRRTHYPVFPRDYAKEFDLAPHDDAFEAAFEFAAPGPEGDWLSGTASYPSATSRPGLLVGIVQTMRKYCEDRTPALLVQLGCQVGALERRLKTRNQTGRSR